MISPSKKKLIEVALPLDAINKAMIEISALTGRPLLPEFTKQLTNAGVPVDGQGTAARASSR